MYDSRVERRDVRVVDVDVNAVVKFVREVESDEIELRGIRLSGISEEDSESLLSS